MALHATSRARLAGPRPFPLVGRRGNKYMFYHDPIAYHRHVYQTYGTLAAFVQGAPKVLAYGPVYNQQIMNTPALFQVDPAPLPGPPNTAQQRLAAGLNSMNGELHRRQRQLMMPAFHKQRVETYHQDMVSITETMLAQWQPNQVRDMAAEMRRLTLCIVSQTLFGIDASEQANSLAHQIERWIALNASMAVRLFPLDYPGSPYNRLMAQSDIMETTIQAMIEQRRNHPGDRHDVLSVLIQARDEDGRGMSDTELIGQATTLFLAGLETSAIALTWTLFLLSQHPQVAADLLDELDHALHGDAPSIQQLNALPLLERVIRESMRLLPPAIQGGRISNGPFSLGSYDFSAGTKVMYSQYITHHMPDIYPQPERFSPERWEGTNPSPYAYIPFITGPRMCIGATFAMTELKIVLAMIVQRFRLTLKPNAVIDRMVKFSMSPKYGMPMQIERQDRAFARSKVPVRGNIHEMVELGA